MFSVLPTVVLLAAGEIILRIASPGWMFCLRLRACPQLGPNAGFMTQRGHNFSIENGEPLLVYHPRLFWCQRSNVQGSFWGTPDVTTNDLGLRDGPVLLSGRRNILVVGDSVVWGLGVDAEHRFSERAEAALAARPGYGNVQFINAGVVGYSSFQVLQYLKEYGLRMFEPDAVVICMGVNDSWFTTTSDKDQFENAMQPLARLRRLLARSDLFLFLSRYLSEFLMWLTTGENPEGFSFLFGEETGPAEVLRNSPAQAVASLREAGDLIESSGGSVVVVLQGVSDEGAMCWDRDAFQEGKDRFSDEATRRGWPIIDVADFRDPPLSMSREQLLLGSYHLTPEAHAVVGYLVAEAVSSLMPPA